MSVLCFISHIRVQLVIYGQWPSFITSHNARAFRLPRQTAPSSADDISAPAACSCVWPLIFAVGLVLSFCRVVTTVRGFNPWLLCTCVPCLYCTFKTPFWVHNRAIGVAPYTFTYKYPMHSLKLVTAHKSILNSEQFHFTRNHTIMCSLTPAGVRQGMKHTMHDFIHITCTLRL